MDNILEIDGKKLYSIKDAVKMVSYSRDYITHLAREDKIMASYIGRQWFVSIESLKLYSDDMALEKGIKSKHLSFDRIKDLKINEIVINQSLSHIKKSRKLHVRAVAVASFVLTLGVLGGMTLHKFGLFLSSSDIQIASTQGSQVTKTVLDADLDVMDSESTSNLLLNVSKKIKSLGDKKTGILLLPEVGNSSSLSDSNIFSDTVGYYKLPDGSFSVVIIDQDGNQVGTPVPFTFLPQSKEKEGFLE